MSRGEVNDAQPNTADEPVVSSSIARGVAGEPAPTPIEMVEATRYSGGEVSLDLRLPAAPSRFTISVELGEQPDRERTGGSDVATGEIRIGGGRALPSLLFVTNRDALRSNIGQMEADLVLEAIRASGQELVDALPRTDTVLEAARPVQQRMRDDARLQGVVLIGGYDVVPSLRLDVLPPRLRARLGASQDPDRFVVWSDDVYGDIVDDDSQPERAVSRIPDGRSADLVLVAIQAGTPRAGSRKGVRNVARQFAAPIYEALPGQLAIAISQPHTFNRPPRLALDADCIYLMLHGDFADSSRFWGEDTPGNVEAVNLTSVPKPSGSVVFTGCCWGALTADQPAERMLPGTAPGQKAPASSIAMTFLSNGANAFIGCTGAHYSPTVEPYDYFGGPMHSAFWQQYLSGMAPAASLLAAKRAYITNMPHGQPTDLRQAIEFKTLHQYTCLGLGW